MRAPPPVEHASAPTRAWRTSLALLVGAGVASLVAWALPWLVTGAGADPVIGALVAFSCGAVAAVGTWLRGPASTATLRWDGQDWVLVDPAGLGPDRRGDVALMLDLGRWMLVRFQPGSKSGARVPGTWLPLTATPDAARWAALRGALWNWRSHEAGR